MTAIKFNSFQAIASIKTLSFVSKVGQGCLSSIGIQKDILSLMAMKTTKNIAKNRKFSGKVREESVEAI